MKKIFLFSSIILATFVLPSCEDIASVISPSTTDSEEESKVGDGLKEALKVGTDSAVSKLNVTDGYFKDEAIKILLPPELQTILANFKSKSISGLGFKVTGETLYNTGFPTLGINPLKSKEDDLVLGINRAAEAAANDAKPIFVNAITGMTIQDANDILFGADTAATNYLRINTYASLFEKFEPKIDSSLKTVKIGQKSVSTLYEDFIKDYNAILNTSVPSLSGSSSVGQLMNLNTITASDLSEYSTNKGLNGLFLKVSEKEADIRNNPLERVTQLLKDVFSKLDT